MAAHVFAAMLMTVAVVAPVSAQQNKTNFDGATSSGLNAMDYRLQKPLGNPSFPEDHKGFGKNFFFGFNAGGALLGNNFSGNLKPGGLVGFRMGSWFSPLHGIRIGADAGINTLGKDVDNTWFKNVHVDYLLNLTSLMRGYNPDRRFELIGILGAQLQRDRYNNTWGTNVGITTSLQTRFNVLPSMYLYLEPQLSVLGGARYGAPKTTNRLHTDLALNFGIGYKVLSGHYREAGSTSFEQKDDDNIYFGVGSGVFGMLTDDPKIQNLYVHTFGGKMFSSTSGLQATIDYGYYRTGNYKHQHLIMGGLDYVLNLNNAFGGYRPNEVFQMILNVGASLANVATASEYRHSRKFYPGVQAGLMGLFRISPNWGIYVHPQVYGFGDSFYNAIHHSKGVPMLSVDMGLRYTIGNYSTNHDDTDEAYQEDTKHWFVTAGGGAYHRMRGDFGNGGNAFIGFGKRFTPVSSWRVNIDGAFDCRHPKPNSFTLHADYLASLTTGMYGYDPDRLFDFQVMVGVFGGTAKYSGPRKATYGLEGGVQANFRVNSSFDIYLEPQALATVGPGRYNGMIWVPDLRVQLGLRYKLKL
ncbi:MAG: hypothetical protein K2M98_03150 [Muribaculum sp.]|nr:hypothetical protein [Muribaculum sp.]